MLTTVFLNKMFS